MKKAVSIILCINLVSINTSCSKNYLETIREPEALFYQGKFQEAARALLPLSRKKGKDQLLYMMECGYIYHSAGDYAASSDVLLPASDLARVVPVSIGKEIASLLTSEGATNYRGEDFEKVLVRMYLGINFLMLGRYDDARVEFKAVNNELARIKSENGEARYKQNLMAKYLTALAFEMTGDMYDDAEDLEFAYIECMQILELNPDNVLVRRDLARLSKKLDYRDDYKKWIRDLQPGDSADEESGEAVFLLQTGRCAIKKSRGRLLDDRGMKGTLAVSLATGNLAAGVTIGAVMNTIGEAENPIPVFVRRPTRVDHVVVRVDGRAYRAELLEDISLTAIRNMEDIYPLLSQKVAASVAVKAAASIAAGIAAKSIADGASRSNNGLGMILGLIVGIGTGTALFSQMKPDLRCWHTLPEKLYLARIGLRPGKYIAVLEFIDSGGNTVTEKTVELTVEKRKKVFINERCVI